MGFPERVPRVRKGVRGVPRHPLSYQPCDAPELEGQPRALALDVLLLLRRARRELVVHVVQDRRHRHLG